MRQTFIVSMNSYNICLGYLTRYNFAPKTIYLFDRSETAKSIGRNIGFSGKQFSSIASAIALAAIYLGFVYYNDHKLRYNN